MGRRPRSRSAALRVLVLVKALAAVAVLLACGVSVDEHRIQLGGVVVEVSGSQLSSSSAAFFVTHNEDSVRVVKLKTRAGPLVTCELQYATHPASATEASLHGGAGAGVSGGSRASSVGVSGVRAPQPQSVLSRLSGLCIRRTLDYWKYELCFEGDIRQSHGRIANHLGRFVGMDGSAQIYRDGSLCEALADQSGRNSRVEFVCDTQLHVRSVEEASTCLYHIVVGTPIVCGHPDFRGPVGGSGGIGGADDGTAYEPWYMELVEHDGGEVMCSAYSVAAAEGADTETALVDMGGLYLGNSAMDDGRTSQLDAAVRAPLFRRFDLSLTTDYGTLEQQYHACRQPDRQDMSVISREYSIVETDGGKRVTLRSADAFGGRLEFLSVQAGPSNLR